MTVVDLGCADHGYPSSLVQLVRRYEPEVIYGFDPSPEVDTSLTRIFDARAIVEQKAAWIIDGIAVFYEEGTRSRIADKGTRVPCFDFSQWLRHHGPMVVKMDIEGAEYPILSKMIVDGTDQLVSELLVEWHGDPARREPLLAKLGCPITEWWQ